MFLLILSLLITGYLIWLFSKLDCDLEVLYALKFGHSIEKLRGKIIWITGSSSGIGEHLAYVLASVGCKLILSGTNEQKLKNVAKQCCSIAQYDEKNVLILPFDISDCSVHQEQFEKILKHFQKLDILVNNAGRSQRAKFLEIEPEVDQQLFAINVFGLINLTRIVLRYFLEHNPDGQIAVTSSTAGILGAPNSASYTGSKHALHGYFECLRTELGAMKNSGNISIQLFCVGPTYSNIMEKAFTGQSGRVMNEKQPPNSPKMSTDRCAYLMAVAMVNKIDQAWITIQPVLLLHYLSQYFPWTYRKVAPKIFTENLSKKLRDGKTD